MKKKIQVDAKFNYDIKYYGNEEFTYAKRGDKIVCVGHPDGSPIDEIAKIPANAEPIDDRLVSDDMAEMAFRLLND